MKISIYTTAWNAIKYGFDYKDALDNWALYADDISVAVGPSMDDTLDAFLAYAKEKNYPVSIVTPDFKTDDPFFYGKMENAALQNCKGDILVQQNLDERWCGDKDKLLLLGEHLKLDQFDAYFIPTIDLYGAKEKFSHIGAKWYIHRRGLYRGAVHFGIKDGGLPDYHKTSTDELIDKDKNLVRTVELCRGRDIETVQKYVATGMPYTFHLGYLSLKDRAERAVWWKAFWEKATGGDENSHQTSVEELLKRASEDHDLPLWKTK